MAIIMHPLTALNGSPEYTADDYRHAINPLLVPSDGTVFNGLSGIRYGSPVPLVTVSGLTVTVKPHCGTISPWDGLGAYTYAITANTTVQLADSTNSYKIAVTVEDPSQSHGKTPRGKLEVFTAGTPDSNINGLVIAEVDAGVASDVAPIIRNNAVLMARDLEQLNTITAMNGQEAVTIADNAHYVRSDSSWKAEPEDRWYRFDLKFQNESSFNPIAYGGGSSIFWHPKLRLISVNLASFISHVGVNTFSVYLPKTGTFGVPDSVRIGQAEFENYTGRGAELTLNGKYAGSISVGPQLSANDIIRPLGSFVVPIPKNVEVRATGGTPL